MMQSLCAHRYAGDAVLKRETPVSPVIPRSKSCRRRSAAVDRRFHEGGAKEISHVPQHPHHHGRHRGLRGARAGGGRDAPGRPDPDLQPGRSYYYTLAAEMKEKGRKVTVSKKVSVRAGQETTVEFKAPEAVVSAR